MNKLPELETSFKPQEEDPGFLVAKGRFPAKDPEERNDKEAAHRSKLANAIYMAIINHGYAHVRAIGTSAIANAVRAITSSTERCRKKGIALMWDTVINKGNLGPMRQQGHVKDVTAYLFRITHWKEVEEKNV